MPTSPVPPSLPPLPRSGDEFVGALLDPRFAPGSVPDAQDVAAFPEAERQYEERSSAAMDHVAASVRSFANAATQYVDALSGQQDALSLEGIEAQMDSSATA